VRVPIHLSRGGEEVAQRIIGVAQRGVDLLRSPWKAIGLFRRKFVRMMRAEREQTTHERLLFAIKFVRPELEERTIADAPMSVVIADAIGIFVQSHIAIETG